LLRLEALPSQLASLSPDPIVGFDTNASQLWVSGTLRQDYEAAAELLADQLVLDPIAMARLLPPNAPADHAARARAFIESFGLRAYRRPLQAHEIERHLMLFQRGPMLSPELDAFSAGMKLSIRLFLQSPYFLYRTELGHDSGGGVITLSGYELAAKLALALTATTPDDQLLSAAAAGSLDPVLQRETYELEVQRLVEGSGSEAAALHFHTQLLALARYSQLHKNSPEFTQALPASLRRSMELFVGRTFEAGGGLAELFTSSTAFVDRELAPIYAVSGQFGSEFVSVDLSALPRRGLLTHPGFLALYAGEQHPDPIHRGVFVSEQILCVALPPPAPDVPALPEARPNQTNRQRIESFTGAGTCGQGCHSGLINPLGFAFEHYDALGRFRSHDAGQAVDAAATYHLDGQDQHFTDALELTTLLAGSTTAHRCYTQHWLSYLYGRLAGSGDGQAVEALAARSLSEDLPIQQVVSGLVKHEAFFTRGAEQP
jgi:hypothetical protein